MLWPTNDYEFLYGYVFLLVVIVLYHFFFAKDRTEGKPFRQHFFEANQTPLSDLQWPVEQLLKSGIHEARLNVRFPDFDLRAKFQKYIDKSSDYGIAFYVPSTDELDSRLRVFRSYCEENEIPFTLVPDLENKQMNWLRIDCGRDSAKAYRLLQVLAVEIAEIPEKSNHEYQLINVLPGDELVDDPDQKPLSDAELSIARDAEFRKRTGASVFEIGLFFVFLSGRFLSYIGLIYAFLINILAKILGLHITWSVVHIKILNITFAPSIFEIACLVIVLISSLDVFLRVYWVRMLGDKDMNLQRSTSLFWYPGRKPLIRALKFKVMLRWNILIPLVVVSWVLL